MTIQGIDRVARRSLLLHRLATLEQPGWVPRFSKAHHISPNLIKSHQSSPKLIKSDLVLRFTKEGWRVDQLEPRLVGMLNVARMQVCLTFFKPNFVSTAL